MKLGIVVGLVVALTSCTPGQRQAARTALDLGQSLCVVSKQALPDEEVLRLCNLVGPFVAPAKELLSGARAASAQAVAGARIAGACAPKP